MNKLLLYMGLAASLLTACDPNGDFTDILDQEAKPAGVDMPEQLTLKAADYKKVNKSEMFTSQAEAAELIPQILTENYAANSSNQGFLMEVSYKLDGTGYFSDLYSSNQEYTLAVEDYTEFGFKYPNFSNVPSIDQYVPVFLKEKFKYNLESGMEKVVSYILRGSVTQLREYKFNGTEWVKTEKTNSGFDVENAYVLGADDYNSMGEEKGMPGKYDNFDINMDIDAFLKPFLLTKYANAQTDDVATISYIFYGNNEGKIVYAFDGDNFLLKGSVIYDWNQGDYQLTNINFDTTDKFVYDSKKGWAIIIITTHTLTDADYALTGDDKYKNFGYYDDVAGTYKEVTVANIIDAKLIDVLSVNYPNAEEGALFEVTYKYYSNGATNDTKRRFKKEGNTFVRVIE